MFFCLNQSFVLLTLTYMQWAAPISSKHFFSVAHRLATELSHCLPPIFGGIVAKDLGFHIQHQPVDVAGVFFLAMGR